MARWKRGIDRFQAKEDELFHLLRAYLVGNMSPWNKTLMPPIFGWFTLSG
jgi:hypothetical protein